MSWCLSYKRHEELYLSLPTRSFLGFSAAFQVIERQKHKAGALNKPLIWDSLSDGLGASKIKEKFTSKECIVFKGKTGAIRCSADGWGWVAPLCTLGDGDTLLLSSLLLSFPSSLPIILYHYVTVLFGDYWAWSPRPYTCSLCQQASILYPEDFIPSSSQLLALSCSLNSFRGPSLLDECFLGESCFNQCSLTISKTVSF